MKIGMIGLGRMGGNMAERLRRHGHEVVGFDHDPKVSQVGTLSDLVGALPAPRVVWVMVPAGDPTEKTVATLGSLLAAGDLVIEGGNSYFGDSIRRAKQLGERGIGFIDAGTSGGIWGLKEGYCIMAGGDGAQVAKAQPIFDALVQSGGFAHVGPAGAGHFTKMVHNGVEYGMMQAFGEGYELLRASELGIDVEKAVKVWRNGSVVRSWLLDLLAKALDEDPELRSIKGWAEDSGEGRWTVQEAVRLGVPAHVLSAALYARFSSRQDDPPAMKVVAALRNQFGGHAVKKET
ncbi:MAG: 6-phosphogluconate dehydrogenase (decarboxylating) [Betaproteobacteria bacterium RIFCSPLOWO2_02_64_14]|nr:MAG: 6-phosphogluconate dehydrogenase (decarboxylating) [Betaproteobacteria bacterium RIFCSPLOWO2_02_64_14]